MCSFANPHQVTFVLMTANCVDARLGTDEQRTEISLSETVLSSFHPVVQAWFSNRYGQPTTLQCRAWETIRRGKHALIASPTGSGKTLAALLPCLDLLQSSPSSVGELLHHQAADVPGVRVLYITPLKALNNDVLEHLSVYLEEMAELASELHMPWRRIRAAVRTGDTSQSQRSAMLRRPPELLITTPESLFILLTSHRGCEMLRTVSHVIVDEIHEVAASRRGAHLSLSIERLQALCGRPIQRIGVSATQNPIEDIAHYLGGWEPAAEQLPIDPEPQPTNSAEPGQVEWRPREVCIVEHTEDKPLSLRVVMPRQEERHADQRNDWQPVVRDISHLLEGRKTAIVFVNNRRLCERLTLRLNEHVGYEMARAHHGSVAREQRLEAERMLRDGLLRCIVATSSLELGIDVGHIDLVIQVDSPKDAASGIQRVGRAGHQIDGVSEGIVVARNRGELAEIAVLSDRIRHRDIEAIHIPRACLDVLSQHIVSMVAMRNWALADLQHLSRHSDSYHTLPDDDFRGVLKIVSGFFPFARPLMDWNRQTDVLSRRPNTAMAALLGAGTIPQSGGYPVIHQANRIQLGELDEEFVHESRVGDVFQLGTSSWMIRSIRHNAVYVVESSNPYSEIPFWKGGALGRSRSIGTHVGSLFAKLEHLHLPSTTRWLMQAFDFDETAATSLATLVDEQRRACAVPTHQQIVLERFTDEVGQVHLVIHSVFGRRFNRTWMLALQQAFARHSAAHVYTYAKDNGIQFVFSAWDANFMESFWNVTEQTVESMLVEALTASAQFAMTFRRLAETSLLLARSYRRTPTWQRRLRAETLLQQALPYAAEFPFIQAAMRECIQEWLDVDSVKQCLRDVALGDIRVVQRDTLVPSPLARLFLAEFAEEKLYESDALQAQIQAGLAGVAKRMAHTLFGDGGRLADGTLSQAFNQDIWEVERIRTEGDDDVIASPTQLVDWLKQRGDATKLELANHVRLGDLGEWLSNLSVDGRIAAVEIGGEQRFICRDEAEVYNKLTGAGVMPYDKWINSDMLQPDAPDGVATSAEFVLGRYIHRRMTFTPEELGRRYGSDDVVRRTMERWLADEAIVPVPMDAARTISPERYMSRAVLERIERASLQKARSGVMSQGARPYLRQLLASHHLSGRMRPEGIDGLRQLIDELQGVFLPASHWESIVFPARMLRYRKEDLDLLCASGEVLWLARKSEASTKEPVIAFFLAKSHELYAPLINATAKPRHPELLDELRRRGASFLAALGTGTAAAPSQLLNQLLELAWDGLISNDQFAPIRHSLTPQTRGKQLRAATGRWYALESLISNPPAVEQSVLGWAWQLLRLNGIVAKPTVLDGSPYSWEALRIALEKFEEWGTVTRGLYLRDVPHIQFATRETASTLLQKHSVIGDEVASPMEDPVNLIVLSAVDPANPYGTLLPWPKIAGVGFSRRSGNFLVIRDGKWLLWIEANGRRIYEIREDLTGLSVGADVVGSLHGATGAGGAGDTGQLLLDGSTLSTILDQVFRTMFAQYGVRKLKIELWDGKPVADTGIADVMRALGAIGDGAAMALWSINLKRAETV